MSVLLLVSHALRAQDVQILMTGEFHKGEVNAQSGETWYGLFWNGDSTWLEKTAILVTPFHDEIMEDKPEEKTGKAVSTDPPRKPVFLVRGLTGLEDRTIKTAFVGDKNIYPGENILFFIERKYIGGVLATGCVKTSTTPTGVDFESYSLYLFRANESFLLADFKRLYHKLPRLIWVGYLDNDDRLDMLWDMSVHYNGETFTLFMSSLAQGEQWLAKAAELVHSGD